MDNENDIVFSWSGGKDSSYCLYKLFNENKYDIKYLFTTLSEEYKKVNFHAIPEHILEQQSKSIGIPLIKAFLSRSENVDEYAKKLESHLLKIKDENISTTAYGDIFLEDLKDFRVKSLSKINFTPIFPIWGLKTSFIINDFVDCGFKAITTCIDTNVLDKSFLGRVIDKEFIAELPPTIDPCGENGEFHTLVFDGPIFNEKISFETGKTIQVENSRYLEIL